MHRPLRYLFWFVRLPTPTPAIPRLIKKEKSPLVSLVTQRPTTLPPPDGRRRSSLPAAVALLPRRRRRRSSLAGGAPSHGGLPSPAKLCELGLGASRCAGTVGSGCIAWGLGQPRDRYLPLLIPISSSCVGC